MTTTATSSACRSIRHYLRVGIGVTILLAGGVGGWAATTQLSGAVIAQGQLVIDSNVKKVQHPTGGVIGELRVRDGSRVKAGDIVIRLDDTQTRANLAIVSKGLDELMAREARDEAERDGAETIAFPKDLLARIDDLQVAHVVQGERKLFEIRRSAREGQKAQLRERIAQLKEEIKGIETQQEARGYQIDWIKKELEGVNELWKKHLVAYSRVTTLERDAARLLGERGQLSASIAQSRGKISELELQIIQIEQDMRAEVGKDLAEIRAKESELVEKKIAAADQLQRIDIRAPQNGVVHQLNVHTVGGVISPSEPIMLVVPESEALVVEAKLQPQDIDQVRFGQKALLRFSAFNQRTTPEVNGKVTQISADVSQDQKSGASFYTVRISVPEDEIARIEGLRLVAGMPVEAFIQTGERTVISYLVKPLSDQILRAFRER
jgi:HlyD family secretion protein